MRLFQNKMNTEIHNQEITQTFIDEIDVSKKYTFIDCKVYGVKTENLKSDFIDCKFIKNNQEISNLIEIVVFNILMFGLSVHFDIKMLKFLSIWLSVLSFYNIFRKIYDFVNTKL